MKKRVIALVLSLALTMGLTSGLVFAADEETYPEITVGGEYSTIFEVNEEDFSEDEDSGYSETVILSLTPEESGAYEISSSAENARSLSVSVENAEVYEKYTAAEYVESVFEVSAGGYDYDNHQSVSMWLEAGVEYYIECYFYAYTSVELTVGVESYDGVVPVSAEYVASEAEHYYTLATSFVSYDDWEYYDEYIYINSLYNITDDLYYDVLEDGIYIADYFGIIKSDSEDVIILTYSDGTTEELYVADEGNQECFISDDGEEYWCFPAWAICEQLPASGATLYMNACYVGDDFSFHVTIPCTIINLADVDIDADEEMTSSDDASSDNGSDDTSSDTDAADNEETSASSSSLSIIDSETTASYTLGSGSSAVIAVDADIETFISVTVDGTVLTQDTDYTVTEGSTIITFAESFLEILSEGDHEVVISFEGGDVETILSIAAAAESSSGSDYSEDTDDADDSSAAEVGDSSGVAFWMALGLIAALGLAGAGLRRRSAR